MNKYQVITLFPDLIEEWKKVGIINQALKNNLIEISKTKDVPSPTPCRQFNFQVPHSKLEIHKNSFFPSSIRLWNSLTDELKNQTDINKFKNLLSKFSILD